MDSKSPAFLVTIPHSGEQIPDQTPWLKSLPEEILMCDVDRFVDRLYESSLLEMKIPFVKTRWHRYAVDLNRVPTDVDACTVQGNKTAAGTHNRGFHWQITTMNYPLMSQPVSENTHVELTQLIYQPFHDSIQKIYLEFKSNGAKKIFHLDAHSMPSVGTQMHRDPGQRRADIVVSDVLGKSASENYVDLVMSSYLRAGFKVAYNWPYLGGRVTEQYGNPSIGHEVLQVELNRDLYMNEATKKLRDLEAATIAKKIRVSLERILKNLPGI
ncbi:MAG: N-formylglutamate amidohydrolase [Bdellovibrionota bacterium]